MRIMKRFALWLVLIVPVPASGQWSLLHTFHTNDGILYMVYFMDFVGNPSAGFVGIDGTLYRTGDGGATWGAVLPNLSGHPSSVCFKNAVVGWCTVDGGLVGNPAVYKTTDGGGSWTGLSIAGQGSDVSYNAATGRLLVSIRSANVQASYTSTDDGATWTAISNVTSQNGFAFCNGQQGILSSYAPSAAGTPFYRTNNGGQTWTSLNVFIHSWSPCAVPGTNTIVAAQDQSSSIWASTDAGVTWNVTSNVSPDHLTGCVQSGPCNMYIQSYDGLYVSGDLKTWTWIRGPGNTYDTRFFVGKTTVYAGDASTGSLYEFQSGIGDWPTLRFTPASITVSAAANCPAQTAFAAFQNLSCLPLTVLSASITDSSVWHLVRRPLPAVVPTGDSVGFQLITLNDTSGTFTGGLQLLIQTTGGLTDTTLKVVLQIAGIVSPTIQPISVTLADRCLELDTVVQLRNNHCDTIVLDSLAMQKSGLFLNGNISLPISIPPDSECTLPFRARPKDRGTFSDTAFIRLRCHGYTLDTTIALEGSVHSSFISADLTPQAANFHTVDACQESFDTVYLRNTSCDSAKLTELFLSGTKFQILQPQLNQWIVDNDSIAIILALPGNTAPGTYSDELDLMLDNGGTQQFYALPVSATVVKMAPEKFVTPATVQRDSIPLCTTFDTTIVFTAQTGCDSISISSLQYVGTGSVFLQTKPALPAELHSGDTIRCTLSWNAPASATLDGSLTVVGTGFDTVVPVHLSMRADSGNDVTLSIPKTAFVASACAIDSTDLSIINRGCAALAFDTVGIVGPMGAFSIAASSLPIVLAPDSSTIIRVYFNGATASSGTATLHAHEMSGMVRDIPLSGTFIPLDTARVALRLLAGSSPTLPAGNTTGFALYFADSVAAETQLQTFDCTLDFDQNILGLLNNPVGTNGWNIQTVVSGAGSMRLSCSRSSTSPISPNETIGTFFAEAFVSDSLHTTLTLEHVTFTPNDPSYEHCVLASAIDPPALSFQVENQCGDSILIRSMRSEPIIEAIAVQPNPLERSSNQTLLVTIEARTTTTADLRLLDLLGRTRMELQELLNKGPNALELPVSSIEHGAYVLEANAQGYRALRQVVILP